MINQIINQFTVSIAFVSLRRVPSCYNGDVYRGEGTPTRP